MTIEKLIEECGDRFLMLRLSPTFGVFEAHSTHGKREWVEFGGTAKEAMTKLHKKVNESRKQ